MPGYRGHLAGGLIAYALILFAVCTVCTPVTTVIGWFIASCAGALFPDIDIKSKGQKYFYWAILIFLIWSIFRFKQVPNSERFDIVAGTSILALLPLVVRHRGITHQPWFIIVLCGAFWLLLTGFFPAHVHAIFVNLLFFAAGAISHVWLDQSTFVRIKFGKARKVRK